MEFKGIQPDLVRFEMRRTSGRQAWEKEVKKPGGFSRFLSGMGRLLGSVSAPLSFVFPPLALASAGMYGLAGMGDYVQAKHYGRMMEAQANKGLQNVVFPGLDGGPVGGVSMGTPQQSQIQPAGYAVSPQQDRVLDVLFAREDAMMHMAQQI